MLPFKQNLSSLILIFFSTLVFSCWLAVTFATNGYEKRKVIIDTDAGADDAMAILMLLSKHSNFDVIGITCVYGNTAVHHVAINVLKTLDTAGRLDIPVYVGSEQGLVYYTENENYFGKDGFGDFVYPKEFNDSMLQKEHPAVYLSDTVKNNPGSITVLAIGPLTNIALASHIYPDLLRDIKDIVVLGGSYEGGGNMRPAVEFNMFSDPEAAAYFFNVVPESLVTLVPYETLKRNSFTKDWRENKLGLIGGKFIDLLNKAEQVSLKQEEEWICFDPSAAAVLLEPNVILDKMTTQPTVETGGRVSRGAMFQNSKPIVEVITSIDKTKLEAILFKYLKE